MSFINVAHDGTEAPAEGGNYEPLPDNTKVLATIVPTEKDSVTIKQVPFSNQGRNANIPALNIRFRIAEGQKGANRNVFARVGLARQFWSDKKGAMVPNYTFFGLFRALGYDVDAPEGVNIESDRELLGKSVELVLGVREYTKSTGEEVTENTVKFINKANGIPTQSTPAAKPTASQPAWSPSAPATASAPAQSGRPAWLASPDEAALVGAAGENKGF